MSERAYLIKAIGFASGVPCSHANQWLMSFNHDAFGGQGYGTFTSDAAKAKHFATIAEAMTFWRRQSTVRPLRPDGKPNRPMTALSIVIDPLP